MSSDERIRVGAVNYLNTKPLVYGLDQLAPQADIVYDVPSRLADGLADGRFDIALVPSIELLRHPNYAIVSDACIGCRGPVLSVKLFMRVPPDQVRTLALDEGSRTSVGLALVLLDRLSGVRPELESLPLGCQLGDSTADAILLIGDRAMHSPVGSFHTVWDLGDQWCRWTGYPFVFAMWTSRAGCELGDLEAVLAAARDAGVANLEQIASREAGPLGLTVPQCFSYLNDNLNFRYGDGERQGMELFFEYAAAIGLAPATASGTASALKVDP
ncbi:MAG TPA: menaquinone biosynthesis protein [Pirellulales bacterium]|nr:menaquinone biosynthesis protein [Pirellulales bacterium]